MVSSFSCILWTRFARLSLSLFSKCISRSFFFYVAFVAFSLSLFNFSFSLISAYFSLSRMSFYFWRA